MKIPHFQLVSLTNLREHWSKRSKRAKAQRETVHAWLIDQEPPVWDVVVTLTRWYCHPRQPFDEGDNLNSAFKCIRDAIAEWIGRDDNDPSITWAYRQERKQEDAVIIHIGERS